VAITDFSTTTIIELATFVAELIKSTTKLTIANRSIPILKVEDVVKDRIAAYIHWSEKHSLIQAAAIILKHKLKPKNVPALL
jgi:activator of HSP90 ATPase